MRLAAGRSLEECVKGIVVIDVVEGTAMAALPHMRALLDKRRRQFESVEAAVRYVVRAGQVRNVESARLSVPREVVYEARRGVWVWRTRLEESAAHWKGWFHGLSQLFLAVPAAKLLVLAGVDRLDKDLMIAQMQGKFQVSDCKLFGTRLWKGCEVFCCLCFDLALALTRLVLLVSLYTYCVPQNMVIPGAGHVVHEDRPSETADVIRDYLVRNCFVNSGSKRSRADAALEWLSPS